MLHPAGVLFRRFTVNTGSNELLCKELMVFIDFFRHSGLAASPARVGGADRNHARISRRRRRMNLHSITHSHNSSICKLLVVNLFCNNSDNY